MELLNESQTERVWQALLSAYENRNTLAEELLDHFCCIIEEQMRAGKSFEKGLDEAFKRIAPNGVDELVEELVQVMNQNNYKGMKTVFYISGMLSSSCLVLSILARHLKVHDMASILNLMGFACLLIFVLPSIVTMAYKNRKLLDRMDKFRVFIGVLSGALISFGMIWKFMHYPGANIMFGLGMLILCLVFFPLFFYQLYKRSLL